MRENATRYYKSAIHCALGHEIICRGEQRVGFGFWEYSHSLTHFVGFFAVKPEHQRRSGDLADQDSKQKIKGQEGGGSATVYRFVCSSPPCFSVSKTCLGFLVAAFKIQD